MYLSFESRLVKGGSARALKAAEKEQGKNWINVSAEPRKNAHGTAVDPAADFHLHACMTSHAFSIWEKAELGGSGSPSQQSPSQKLVQETPKGKNLQLIYYILFLQD